MASPVVANGIVYGSLFDNDPFALNASTGATLWTFLKVSDGSPVSVANGVAYFGARDFDSTDDNVYAVDASTGARLWNFTTAPESI